MHQFQGFRSIDDQAIKQLDQIKTIVLQPTLRPERTQRPHPKHRRNRCAQDLRQQLRCSGIDRILNRRLAIHLIGQQRLLAKNGDVVTAATQTDAGTDGRTADPRLVRRLEARNQRLRFGDVQRGKALNQHPSVLGWV